MRFVNQEVDVLPLKKNSGIIEKLHEMVKLETAGDPMGGVSWIRRSLSTLSKAFKEHYGINISPRANYFATVSALRA